MRIEPIQILKKWTKVCSLRRNFGIFSLKERNTIDAGVMGFVQFNR